MKRLLVVLCLVVGLVGGAGFRAADVALAASGNSDAAHACQQGGYLTLPGPGGSTFANTGDCVSFFARGGTITGVTACTVTSITGCLTFDNATLTDPGGNTITLTGSTSFVDDCPSGYCVSFTLPNNLATGGGTYVERDSSQNVTSSGTYQIANTAGSGEGLFSLFYQDGSGALVSSCSAATGVRGVGVQATLIDSSGQVLGTASIGADAGSLLTTPVGILGTGTDTFFGTVPGITIAC